MSDGPECVYGDCSDSAKVVRKVSTSGRELTYCRAHDPLREDSDVQEHFEER